MKILAVGDPHAKSDNHEDIRQLSKEVLRVAKENSPDYICVLGDFSNDFDKMNVYAFAAISEFFQSLKDYQTIYLIGNHDLVNNSQYLSKQHFFGPFNSDRVRVVDDYVLELGEYLFCPYVPNGRLKEALGTIGDFRKAKAIFCHQEIKGVSFGHGMKSEHGDEWELDHPLLVSGHIHNAHFHQPNVYYVGSSTQTNFGEADDKSLAIIEGSTIKQMPIKINKKINIQSDIKEFDPNVINSYDSALTKVRVSLSGTSAEVATYKKSKAYKDLQEKAKVIFKITDTFQAKIGKNMSFSDIIKEKAATEPLQVQAVLKEVLY